jgi:hypothetical protein
MKTNTTPGFRAAIVQAISIAKAEVARMMRIIEDMEALIGEEAPAVANSTPTPRMTKTSRTKKGKRTPEEVNQQAKEMLAFIKKAGEDGVTGKEINAKFGKVVGTTRAFVESRTGEKVKTKGERSAMRYFAV